MTCTSHPISPSQGGQVTRLRPFFCYYGGKWRAAPKYPPPEHDTIVEPFAGAAGYATRYALMPSAAAAEVA